MINIEYLESTGMLLETVDPMGIEEIDEYNLGYFSFVKEIDNKYTSKHVDEVNPSVLDTHFLTKGFTELIIKTTDSCNYRCNYCLYSDYYPYTASFGNTQMKEETAIKAIDYYLNHVKKQKGYLYNKKPFIAFYGGEPLLNFRVIKASIEYVQEHYPDLRAEFTITTNGSLLADSEVSDFLIRHNVIICISLDGYPANHDRNRLQQDKKATFDELVNILNRHFKDYPRIYSLCCIDYKTDLFKLYDFYINNDRLNGGTIPHLLRITFISGIGTSYHDQFKEDEILLFMKQMEILENKYIKLAKAGKKDWFLNLLFDQEYLHIYDRPKFRSTFGHYSMNGCCIPGEKLFVLPDGTFNICEKAAAVSDGPSVTL